MRDTLHLSSAYRIYQCMWQDIINVTWEYQFPTNAADYRTDITRMRFPNGIQCNMLCDRLYDRYKKYYHSCFVVLFMNKTKRTKMNESDEHMISDTV